MKNPRVLRRFVRMIPNKMIDLDESLVEIHPHANAFRVVLASEDGCFLDFLHWDKDYNTASVVSRIKVRSGFLPLIRCQLESILSEIGDSVVVC